ncbi:MAG: fused MFS/spermidine synthase [Elusimicrobia bacterium]|nr:fused MFS/spermidine synthase [Elusimicrobiota bacterium]
MAPLIFFGVLNFAVLGLEVAWTRALAFRFLETTIYSFSCVVASTIVGMALGGLCGSISVRRFPRAEFWYAAGVPAWSVLSWNFLPWMGGRVVRWFPGADPVIQWNWRQSISAEMFLSAIPLLIPGFLLGVVFLYLVSTNRERRWALAELLAMGAGFGALGALVIGLGAIPLVGIRYSIFMAVLPLILFLTMVSRSWGPVVLSWAFSFFFIFFSRNWSGAVPAQSLVHRVLFLEESAGATVEVWEDFSAEDSRWERTLLVDGHAVAGSDSVIQADQKLLAHIPLLLHPNPRKALTVGLGSGGTSYSMRLHGAEVFCYEILPAVRRAAELFPRNHRGVFLDSGFHLEIGDARHLLLKTRQRFDVIVSDVTDIYFLGNASLLSRDYFKLAQSRLNPGGIFAVWLPRDPGKKVLASIFSTFLSVFPRAVLWYPYQIDSHFTILVGLPPDWKKIDWEDWRNRISSRLVQKDLASIASSDPLRLANYLALNPEEVRTFASDAAVHSDFHPLLDFQAARLAHVPAMDLLRVVSKSSSGVEEILDFSSGFETSRQGAYQRAREKLIQGYLALSNGDNQQALQNALEAEKINPTDRELIRSGISVLKISSHLRLAEQRMKEGEVQGAAKHLQEVIRLRPNHFTALNNLAMLKMKSGDVAAANRLLKKAGAILPEAEWVQKLLYK